MNSNTATEIDDTEVGSKFSDFETAKLSLSFCILWFLANWATNASLLFTTVGSSTILSSTSGIFTLFLGASFKVEKFTWTKILGVVVSFGGVILVGISSSGETGSSKLTWKSMIIGDAFSLLGAFFYGCYTIYLKARVGEGNVDMRLFLGIFFIF